MLRPIRFIARAATFRYRAGKFARRHWGKIALAGFAVAALASSTAVSFVQAQRAADQAQRAERRFDEVRALAHSLVFELDPKLRDLKGATAARELVVKRGAAQVRVALQAALGGERDCRDDMRVGELGPSRLRKIKSLHASERLAPALRGLRA